MRAIDETVVYFYGGADEGCISGHFWHGTGTCSRCGERLRCCCGRFVAEGDIDRHLRDDCPTVRAADEEEA
jgi:hypothetical protein